MKTDVWIFAQLYLAKYPATLGTDILRWSKRPRSLPGEFYEPRIYSISEITRSRTDEEGNWITGSVTLTLSDQDGVISTLLDEGAPTEYWTQREFNIWAISEEGVASGLSPDNTPANFRGFVTDIQCKRRVATLTVAETLGSQMSGFNLGKKCLRWRIKDLNPNAPENSANVPLRILVGEFTTNGWVNSQGINAEKGLVPAHEVGEVDITDTSAPATPTYAAPPVITVAVAHGATGQQSRSYGATVITPYGESSMSNIVTIDGASTLNLSNYNEISGTFDVGPDPANPYKVRIWYGPTPDNMVGWLDEAYYASSGVFGYYHGAAPWPGATRDEDETVKYMDPPQTNNAQTNTGIFSIMFTNLGYGYEYLKIHASDLADGVEPKRTPLTVAEHGSVVITPDDPQWPYPNPWIELNGIVFTGFLMRGPKLQHHRDKVVTIAVDICGPHDATGKAYTQAFPSMQFLLNEFGVKNKGSGFKNHTYGTLETFENGDSMFQTSTTTACQNKTIDWIGGLGYQSQIWIDDETTTWRDVVQDFCNTFGSHMYENRFGQTAFMLVDTVPDAIEGRHFREKIEIKRFEDDILKHDLVVNRFLASYYYDLDAGEYKWKDVPFDHNISQAAHVPGGIPGTSDPRGVKERPRICAFTNDATTFNDVMNRELVRRQRRPRYLIRTVPMMGLDYDINYRGRITDSNGLGPLGDVETPVLVTATSLNLIAKEVTLTFQDLRAIWTGAPSTLGDETITGEGEAALVGDEASIPPTAEEIR
jgi:hypothetical protein